MKTCISKILIAAIVCLFSITTLGSCGSAGEFSQLKQCSGTDVVHLPKGATFLLSSMVGGNKEASSLMRSLGSVDVVSCEGNANRAKVLEVTQSVISKEKAELILETAEGNENVRIYGKPDTNKGKVSNVIIISDEPGELSVVRMKGSMDLKTLMNSKSAK